MSATFPRTHDSISLSGSLSKARHVFHKLKRRASSLLKRDIPASSPPKSDFITPPLPVNLALDASDLIFRPSPPLVTHYERQRTISHTAPPSLTYQYPTFSPPHPYSNMSAYRSSPSLPSSSSSSSPRSSFYSSSSTYAPLTPFSPEFPITLSVHDEEDPFAKAAVHIAYRNPTRNRPSCPLPTSPSPSPTSSTFRTSTSSRARHISLPYAPPPPSYPPPLPPRSPHRPPPSPPGTNANSKFLTPPPSPEFQRREVKRDGGRTEKRRPAPLWLDRSRPARSTSSFLDTFPSPPPTPRELREFVLSSPTPSLRVELKSQPLTPSSLSSPQATPRRGDNWLDLSVHEEDEDGG